MKKERASQRGEGWHAKFAGVYPTLLVIQLDGVREQSLSA